MSGNRFRRSKALNSNLERDNLRQAILDKTHNFYRNCGTCGATKSLMNYENRNRDLMARCFIYAYSASPLSLFMTIPFSRSHIIIFYFLCQLLVFVDSNCLQDCIQVVFICHGLFIYFISQGWYSVIIVSAFPPQTLALSVLIAVIVPVTSVLESNTK